MTALNVATDNQVLRHGFIGIRNLKRKHLTLITLVSLLYLKKKLYVCLKLYVRDMCIEFQVTRNKCVNKREHRVFKLGRALLIEFIDRL